MFNIKIAGVVIAVHHQYPQVKQMCKDYITTEVSVDFEVEAPQEAVLKEQKNGDFTLGYCESVCIYREIVRKLPAYGAFFLHASVVETDGWSYAFLAKSGTGKSTHTSLWLRHFKEQARIINGDKPLFRFIDNQLYVYGTPWCGKEGYNINTSSPLRALCFLERGTQNAIRRLADNEIVERLFGQVVMPQNAAEMDCFLRLLDQTVRQIPVWLLTCNISEEAVMTAYQAMSRETNERERNTLI